MMGRSIPHLGLPVGGAGAYRKRQDVPGWDGSRAETGRLRFWWGQGPHGELDTGWMAAGTGQAGRLGEQKAVGLGARGGH